MTDLPPPPERIDGAAVLVVADLTGRTPTGAARHFVDGDQVTDFAALAVATYGEDDYYLFYCDRSWEAITDTLHASRAQAIDQATAEFGSVEFVDRSEWIQT